MSKKPQSIPEDNPFSWQVTLLPIIFIIVTAGIFSGLDVLELHRDKQKQIEKVTTEFIDRHKSMARNQVVTAAELIRFQSSSTEDLVRKRVKDRVDEAIHIANAFYEKYHGTFQEKDLKEQITLLLSSAVFDHPDGYFFAVDMETEKIIIHQLDTLVGYSMSQHKDLRGQAVLTEQKKLLSQSDGAFQVIYFSKPTEPDKEFPKQLYIRYFKPFNWLIGTGEYLDDMEKRLQKEVLERFEGLYTGGEDYLFIQEIFNLNGSDDKPYGRVILCSNPAHWEGQPLFTTDQDSHGNYYSSELLSLVRDQGEGFLSYWHPSPEHGREVKKTSYFLYDKSWNWVIGSGFYYDSLDMQLAIIEKNIAEKVMKEIWSSTINTLLIMLVISSIFFVMSRSTSRTINRYSTKLQHALRTTEQALVDVKKHNKALEQFNYAVSHELKTPLVTIEASLGLIQDRFPQATDHEQSRVFGYARNAARQMNRLLESLLLIFRIDTTDTKTEAINFSELVQDAIDRLTRGNSLQGIKVTISTEGPVLNGDREKLVQTWQHLIENAAKYMADQKQPTIDIGVEQSDEELLFYVRDNGVGIEKPDQDRIFNLFEQLDNSAGGMGMGLPLAQRIVEYYGGTIRVESAGVGQGSCFYFTLPDALVKERTTG